MVFPVCCSNRYSTGQPCAKLNEHGRMVPCLLLSSPKHGGYVHCEVFPSIVAHVLWQQGPSRLTTGARRTSRASCMSRSSLLFNLRVALQTPATRFQASDSCCEFLSRLAPHGVACESIRTTLREASVCRRSEAWPAKAENAKRR